MKKLVLLVACAFVAAGAFAQPKLGIKAGLNLADISNVEDSKMKPSFYAGAFVDFQISDCSNHQLHRLPPPSSDNQWPKLECHVVA